MSNTVLFWDNGKQAFPLLGLQWLLLTELGHGGSAHW